LGTKIRTSTAWIVGLRDWLRSSWNVLAVIGALIPVIALAIYIKTYPTSYPFGDTSTFSAPTAISTKNGDLTITYLFSVANGHRIVFTRLVTVLLTIFTNWNLEYEVVISFILGVTNVILTTVLFFRYFPKLVHWFLIPCSALILTLQQSANWLVGVQSCWHFVLMFVLLGMVTLCYGRQNLGTVAMAAFFALCATFSFATGLLAYPLLVLTMWMVGYRQKEYYLLIGLVAVVVIAAYFVNSGIEVAETGSSIHTATVLAPRLSVTQIFVFIFTFLGGPLAADYVPLAFLLGVIGLSLVTVNFWLIQRLARNWNTLAPWIILALFALGSGLLIAFGRSGYYGDTTPITRRYIHPATCLWISVVATSLIVIAHVLPQLRTRRKRLLQRGFRILGISFVSLYFATIIRGLGFIEYRELAIYIPISSTCSQAYIFTRNETCLIRSNPAYLDVLAYYNLAGYSTLPDRLILPDSYRPGDQVVVASAMTWLNYHIADRLLSGVPENDIYTLIPKEEEVWIPGGSGYEYFIEVVQPQHPQLHLVPYNVTTGVPEFTERLSGQQAVWMIRQLEEPEFFTSVSAMLNSPVLIATTDLPEYNLSVEEYTVQ
jgi:hypothetical protein